MKNIRFDYLEIFNYCLIIAENILIVGSYYKSPTLDIDIYNKTVIDDKEIPERSFYLVIAHIVFLFIILVFWGIYKFPLHYQHSLMKKYHKNFIFKSDDEERDNKIINSVKTLLEDKNAKILNIINELNYDITGLQKFIVAFIDSIVYNVEINIFFFTIILLILYLTIKNPIIQAVPVLFLYNLVLILFDIVTAMRLKFNHLITVLLFTYLVIYIYSWITILSLNEYFVFSDVVVPKEVNYL
jgi:hypothetical protein